MNAVRDTHQFIYRIEYHIMNSNGKLKYYTDNIFDFLIILKTVRGWFTKIKLCFETFMPVCSIF